METFKKILGIYASAGFISILTFACCNENTEIVGKGTINAYHLGASEPINNMVTGPFNIIVLHETNRISGLTNMSLIQSSYATSCEPNYLNQLDESTLTVTSDHDILLNGNTISAGTNLIKLEEVDLDMSWADIWVTFDEAFIQMANFGSQAHTFTIDIATTDAVQLTNSITLSFDLQ